MKPFNPNDHSVQSRFFVTIKRLGKEFPVSDLRTLKKIDNQGHLHVWGFANVHGSPREFDSTWGDVIRQEVV